MLTQRAPVLARFTRSDAMRLAVAATSLVVALTAILAFDLPADPVRYEIGEVVREDITASRAVSFDSTTLTEDARQTARAAVPFQFDFTADNAIAIANEQAAAFTERVRRVDTAFATDLTAEERTALLETAIPGLSAHVASVAGRHRRAPLGGGPNRGCARPRCHASHRAARHRGRGDPRHDRGADGRRSRRGGTDARRRDHRAARRPELVVR